MNEKEKRIYIEEKVRAVFINNGEFKEFTHKVPKFLYKYSPANDNCLDALKNSYLWCSSSKFLNDPFECNIIVNKNEIDKFAPGVPSEFALGTKNIMLNKANILKEQKSKINITSLSEKNNDILMWSYYSDSHRGVCFEFSFEEINRITNSSVFPVLYEKELTRLSDLKKQKNMAVIKHHVTKYKGWEHENEWRIINPNAIGHQEYVFDNREFIGIKIFIKPTKIFLGCRIKEEKEILIRKIAEENGIPVEKFKANGVKYRLEL